ncbi:CPCC family cysteine-rich protein [Nocardiopsis sp. CNT312]|uniref:CPCC family cysteine-rich protein n=1 Tax=Nocardiopsis sp. CNT312 TaxID=1137268 RepID=UPI0009DF2EA9
MSVLELGGKGILIRFPCPCCGFRVHEDPPGSHMICPVCDWEDDPVQLRWPRMPGGANKASLYEAQRIFKEANPHLGETVEVVKNNFKHEVRDPGWRMIDFEIDDFEDYSSLHRDPWPDDRTLLYWWRDSFWRLPGVF